MTIRKAAAIAGVAKASPRSLRNREPDHDRRDRRQHDQKKVLPVGAERVPVGRTGRAPKLSQSRQKKMKSAIAVPKCMTTR